VRKCTGICGVVHIADMCSTALHEAQSITSSFPGVLRAGRTYLDTGEKDVQIEQIRFVDTVLLSGARVGNTVA